MIVTCENCGARYKLDESRLKGRGARITCPKCRHKFVVYREGEESSAATTVSTPSSPPGRAKESPDQSGRPRVEDLDFRSVGVTGWKVKVKIGLVYDFSDFRTLKKYIQDGRVTNSDLLSHDAQNWTPIGQIPDLEAHFVDVFLAAQERKAAADARSAIDEDEPFGDDDDSPTTIVGMGALEDMVRGGGLAAAASSRAEPSPRLPVAAPPAPRPAPPAVVEEAGGMEAALAEALAAETGEADAPDGPRFVDPFQQMRSRKQAEKGRRAAAGLPPAAPRPPAQSGSKGRPGLRVLLLVVVAVGAIGLVASGAVSGDGVATAPTPPPSPPVAAPDQTNAADARAEMIAKLEKELPLVDEEPSEWADEKPDLLVVRPTDAPRNPNPVIRPTPNGSPSNSAIQVSASNAGDYAAVGDSAAARGDWTAAVGAYGQAVALEPANANWLEKLGMANYRAGRSGDARARLVAAVKAGSRSANKWLGHLSRDEGDVPGAIGYYQTYLKTSPSDAAQIQREIDALKGS